MNTENQTPNKYKRYDEAFKRSAVELWLQGGKSVQQIAGELGISTQSLKQWKKQLAAWTRRAPSPRAQANTVLLPLIEQAHWESRQTYGRPRITH